MLAKHNKVTKHGKITYALGSAHEKFRVCIKAVPKSKDPAQSGGNKDWSTPNQNTKGFRSLKLKEKFDPRNNKLKE